MANQEQGCIFTGIDEGEGLQRDYLRLFTYTMDSRVRILSDHGSDPDQHAVSGINDSFLLREYNGGVRFVMKVNGVDHEMVKKY